MSSRPMESTKPAPIAKAGRTASWATRSFRTLGMASTGVGVVRFWTKDARQAQRHGGTVVSPRTARSRPDRSHEVSGFSSEANRITRPKPPEAAKRRRRYRHHPHSPNSRPALTAPSRFALPPASADSVGTCSSRRLRPRSKGVLRLPTSVRRTSYLEARLDGSLP